ncbi:MAG: hypothetical protein PVI26_11250 [Chitinispirillia bacterium]|jgi:hypothetical protein
MYISKIFTVTIFFFFFLISFGCNRSICYKLYGKWITDDELSAVTMIFDKNGNVLVKYQEGVELKGSWAVDTDNNIKIDMDIWSLDAEIEEDKLILINKNSKKTYRKLK